MFHHMPGRTELTEQNADQVVVYGTSWCAATQMVRRYLDRQGLAYIFRDIERDPEALAKVKWITGGYASHPTVQIDGEVLVEPSISELRSELAQHGMV